MRDSHYMIRSSDSLIVGIVSLICGSDPLVVRSDESGRWLEGEQTGNVTWFVAFHARLIARAAQSVASAHILASEAQSRAHTRGVHAMTKDKIAVSLVNSYRNLAQLWRESAAVKAADGDIYGVHRAVTHANACDTKAREIARSFDPLV